MPNFNGQIILIVDDQPNNLQVLSDTLSAANLQVAVALNGEGALEQIQHLQPDLILLDVMMPGIDGFETCRRILAIPAMREVPILFMTALSDVDYKTQGFEAGAVDYITKPFQQAEVFARIQVHLKLHSMNQLLEEKNQQLQLAKDKADHANRVKSEFLANMSHELRTPLNGVMGYAQGLQMSKNLDSREQGWVDSIYMCGSHLLTLIDDVLDISKIEAEKLELLPHPIYLEHFLQQLVAMFELRAEEDELHFAVELCDNLPTALYADEKRLRQVLINLLGNAFKFTSEGGVTLRVQHISPKKTRESIPAQEAKSKLSCSLGKLRFEIEDTGIGIAPENQNKIFEPFEQTPASKQSSQGTGLGLSISSKILELMGSQIKLHSEINRGSLFSFEILAIEPTKRSHLMRSP